MVWCSHCEIHCNTTRHPESGCVCCGICGKLIDESVFSRELNFEKLGSGQSRLAGSILHSTASAYSLSRQKTLNNARNKISSIVNRLNVIGGDSMINKAHNLYKIAVERNFTKGRISSHVAAACIYIVCRQTEKALLLIDFSDYLEISVYVLGAVFLQLCKMLRLSDHPIVQKLIDPSLFIHRFTERLLGERNDPVSEIALRIVASMKRDWMQAGNLVAYVVRHYTYLHSLMASTIPNQIFHCEIHCNTTRHPESGCVCCGICGKLIDESVFSRELNFEKLGSGQSRLAGSILHSTASAYSLSRQKTLNNARNKISSIVNRLNVIGGDSMINKAHNLYKIAVERNFTKGRISSHVAAACIYIVCRQTEKALLLIDFSDYLEISVYVLGAVFLQLCKMLRLSDHPIVQKLIDPSLFIHRFTERLLGERNDPVSEIALRIVASMKRDWMQTGRKPSGLCGAALYISALSHGFNYSKSDIVNVVHICEATLTKRLIEFENTESACLTIDDFIARADELNDVSQSYQSPTPGQVLCEHKDTNEPHFAHGLCKQCFNEFIKFSGGLKGGAEPPAFQHAEMQRMEKMRAEGKDMQETDLSSKPTADSTGFVAPTSKEAKLSGHSAVDACSDSEQDLHEGTGDPESFSDIDDVEVDGYLHNEEEKKYKKIIWEEMNKEYLEEQAAKEAAAAEAAKQANEATMSNNSEEFLSAQELAAATAAALANSKKEKRQKRAAEKRNSKPANSPLEATCQLLKRKSFSSKINYKALEGLYTDSAKKQRTDNDVGEDDNGGEKESDEDAAMDGGDGFGAQANAEDHHDYDYEHGDEGYGNVDNYYGNEGDNYGNGDDGHSYDYWEE